MNSDNIKSKLEQEFHEIDSKGAWPFVYQQIRNESNTYDFTVEEARKSENKNLNRYRDVSPYDHTRIVLDEGPCNYINASLVKMEKAHRQYILTQGPLPNTAGHFWLMIWEKKCKGVLMLNRIVEKNQVKCHQYWPLGSENGGEDSLFLDDVGLRVDFISEKQASYYTTRTLRLTELKSGTSREILHFHYTTWPDFGVPQSPTAFLNFLVVVRKSGALDENVGPPIVHCSAGIGRSGTFCLVDSCLVLIEEYGEECVNIQEVLLEMRKCRMGLIQTPDQLRFSYLAIIKGKQQILERNQDGLAEDNDAVENHVDEEREETIEDEPPPLPPPRAESLVRSTANDTTSPPVLNHKEHVASTTESSTDPDPPDRPLPNVPPEDSQSSTDEDEETAGSPHFTTPPSSPENSAKSKSELSELRKRVRETKKESIRQKVQDMKRKQQGQEKWLERKRFGKRAKKSRGGDS